MIRLPFQSDDVEKGSVLDILMAELCNSPLTPNEAA